MIFFNTEKRSYRYYLLLYFLLWIILFEFLLPVNKILPRPSIVLISFADLWGNYNLPVHMLSTIAVIYFSIALSYFFLKYILRFLSAGSVLNSFIISFEWFSKYVPGIILGLFLIFWFPNSEYIEFVFAFLASFFSLLIKANNYVTKINEEYIDAAKSLKSGKQEIEKIKWKSIQPEIFSHLFELHYYIWLIILAFEFFKGGFGLGSLLRSALSYNDLSALFSVTLIIGFIVFIGTEILKYLNEKFAFWKYK